MLATALTLLLTLAPPATTPNAPEPPPPAAAPAPPAPATAAPTRPVTFDRLQWMKDVDGPEPITTIEVRNDFGDIRARAAAERRAEAWMVVQRLDPAGDRVGFTVERRGGVVALTVAYPPGRVRDADPRPAKDSYDRLDLVVYVPQGVTLRARTLRGEVDARRLGSDIDASTLDGPVYVATRGGVQARTQGGPVTVMVAAEALASAGAPLVLQSDSGPIRVVLPENAAAELRVETAGAVSSPLPLNRSQLGARTRATLAPAGALRLLLATSATGAVTIERE